MTKTQGELALASDLNIRGIVKDPVYRALGAV